MQKKLSTLKFMLNLAAGLTLLVASDTFAAPVYRVSTQFFISVS